MARFRPIINEGAEHWLRKRLPAPAPFDVEDLLRKRREDIAFFLISFAAGFVILYSFVI